MRELDRVIGYENIKAELYRFIDIIKNPEKYKKLGAKMPKGIMLDGEPGIGKTLMAKSFIAETGLKSFVIRKDMPDGEFIDYISEVFDKAAEAAPSVVLLDDLDKFANEDVYHRDAEEYVTVQACIDGVKDLDVLVVATCNNTQKLPGSLLRSGRFDRQFYMRFPGIEDAKKIIEFYLKDKKISGNIDAEEIARFCEGHSCADLETVINEAGIFAGYANEDCISQENIKKACIIKMFGGSDSESSDPSLDRKLAVHEVGHAVMSEVFFPGRVAFVSIETNYRGVRGMVKRNKDAAGMEYFENAEKEIMICLAGKAATELLLNDIDLGVSVDLHAVDGHLQNLIDANAAYTFKSDFNVRQAPSDRMLEYFETAKEIEIARYYVKTKQFLSQNRKFLEACVEKLIEKRTLSYKDIATLREMYLGSGSAAA